MNSVFIKEFIEQAIFRMEENPPRIENCLDRLSEAEVWQKPNSASNSIGNLILHLCGNITQYIISSLGNAPDLRARDLEFATPGGLSKTELLEKFNQVIRDATRVIQETSAEQLIKKRSVQGFDLSGIGIIIHVVEHLSYHTGQIAYWTKILKDQDLGFYKDINLNLKNQDNT